jgi:hypothetical protein
MSGTFAGCSGAEKPASNRLEINRPVSDTNPGAAAHALGLRGIRENSAAVANSPRRALMLHSLRSNLKRVV